MKRMAIVIALVVAAATAFAQQAETTFDLKVSDWDELSDEAKLGFVLGYVTGIDDSEFTLEGTILYYDAQGVRQSDMDVLNVMYEEFRNQFADGTREVLSASGAAAGVELVDEAMDTLRGTEYESWPISTLLGEAKYNGMQ